MSLKKFYSFWVLAVTEDIKRTPAGRPKIDISTRTKFEKRWNNLKKHTKER